MAGAVGTFAAVTVALLLAVKDNRRLASELRDREASTARLVSATIRRGLGLSFLEIRNDSREAIHDLDVQVTVTGPGTVRVTGQNVEDRNGRFVAVGPGPATEGVRALRPGEVRRLVVQAAAEAGTVDLPGSASVTLRFTDSAGLRWLRTTHEPPRRLLGD
ncbi:hypothetical protein ACWCPF_44640 [Streptomyces sp. NPDC001858]